MEAVRFFVPLSKGAGCSYCLDRMGTSARPADVVVGEKGVMCWRCVVKHPSIIDRHFDVWMDEKFGWGKRPVR